MSNRNATKNFSQNNLTIQFANFATQSTLVQHVRFF